MAQPGFDIYLYGDDSNIILSQKNANFVLYRVLGIDRENHFNEPGKKGTHGGYRKPTSFTKEFVLNFMPVSYQDYDAFIDSLYALLTKKNVYFNRGTHFTNLTTDTSAIRIVPIGEAYEHDYQNGTKSIDIPVGIYG